MKSTTEGGASGGAVRCFMDDGRWMLEHVEPAIGFAERPYGFLEIRCEGAPDNSFALVAGGYEQLDNGRWSADVLLHYDLENGSSYRPLGEFATQADAMAAVWLKRQEAILPPDRTYVVDATIEASWQQMEASVAGRGPVIIAALASPREYHGRVLATNPFFTAQNLGRSVAVHATESLGRSPAVGELLSLRPAGPGRMAMLEGVGAEHSR